MTVVAKKQRFAILLWALVLALIGGSFAQNPRRLRRPLSQQPEAPTAEQEAAPNTSGYPQSPAYTPANSYPQPTTPIYNQQAPATVFSTQQPVQPVVNPAPQINPAQTNPVAVPQNQGFIGPPVPVPPTPEQMPPAPPKISYQNGLLSVESVNSRLTDILNGIHTRTGIQFEGLLPGQDRVAGKFGPAPAEEVLTALLQGSRYDYVIIGLADNPALVQRVILTPNAGVGTVAGVAGSAMGGNPQANENEEEDNGGEEPEGQQEQVQTPPQQLQPLLQPGQNNTPKTTEQLLEELKQIQQRNQQSQPPTAPLKPTVPR
ncbi:MAG TPA: hypothetical protein VI636_19135 [Candidatus Angelobacter sp.]